MASLRKAHKTWIACITLANGSRTERSTRIKDQGTPQERADARRAAADVAQQMEESARGNKSEAQIRKTISELYNRVNAKRLEFTTADAFFNQWLITVEAQNEPSTHLRYKGVVDRFLKNLGNRRNLQLSEIGADDIQSYVDARVREDIKSKTISTDLKILNRAFVRALKQGLVASNPVPTADFTKTPGESKEPFSTEQVRAILRVSDGDWLTANLLGTYLGARLGDCANFTHANIDHAERILRYRPGKTEKHKKDVACPIHPALYAHLAKIPCERNDQPLTPTLHNRKTGGRSGLSHQFNLILERAGVANPFVVQGKGAGRGFKALGFHSFRHTFKTLLVNSGVPVETVDVLVGHAKKTVSERYIHRSSALLKDAILKLPHLIN